MLRVVLDTNIIISALLWGGPPARIMAAAFHEQFIALQTNALLQELRSTLAREKFAARLTQRHLTVDMIIERYQIATLAVDAADIPSGIVRDPKDMMVLACAVGGRANYIVSGDKDLLVLGSYADVFIVAPGPFLDELAL